jgi:two-component system, OmpR family, response regulator
MSPVAAEVASAESAPGPVLPEPLEDFAEVAEEVAVDGGDAVAVPERDEPDEPHPASRPTTAAAAEARQMRERDMVARMAPGSGDLLNAGVQHEPFRKWSDSPLMRGHTRVMHPTVLLVEDDHDLRAVLVRSLSAEGFSVRACATGHQFVSRAEAEPPDVLVIDIGLPDADGRDVCQALRARGVTSPVLFLTAKDALPDRLSGFNAGGDDYVTKPFDIEELSARLHALMRRAGSATHHSHAGLLFDPTQFTVAGEERATTLTPTEFRLLACLAASPGDTVPRTELIYAAWPHGAIVHDNTLDVYVARLRRKLREIGAPPRLATVHGVGYRFECDA